MMRTNVYYWQVGPYLNVWTTVKKNIICINIKNNLFVFTQGTCYRSCPSMAVDGSTVVAFSATCLQWTSRGRKPDRSTQCSLTATGYPPRLHVCFSFPNKLKKSIYSILTIATKSKVNLHNRLEKEDSSCCGHRRNLQLDRTQWITERAAEGGAQPALTGLRSTSLTEQLQTEASGPVVYYYRFKWRLGRKQKPE